MFRALTTLALLSLFLSNPIQAEDQETFSFEDIRKKFSPKENPFKLKPLEHPLCRDLFQRKSEENRAIILAQLSKVAKESGNDAALKAFLSGTYQFPNGAMMQKTQIERTEGGMGEPAVYFSGDTLIERLILPPEGEHKTGSVSILDFNQHPSGEERSKHPEDQFFVLTSTQFIMDDERYQSDCWAEAALISKDVQGGTKMGVVHYERGMENKAKLKIALFTQPKFYGSLDGKNFVPTVCSEIKLGSLLFTSDQSNDLDRAACKFATLDDKITNEQDTKFYNLAVKWTGAYYVGPTEAQVLVKN